MPRGGQSLCQGEVSPCEATPTVAQKSSPGVAPVSAALAADEMKSVESEAGRDDCLSFLCFCNVFF